MGIIAIDVAHIAHGEDVQLLVSSAALHPVSDQNKLTAIGSHTVALTGNRTGQVMRHPRKLMMISSLK